MRILGAVLIVSLGFSLWLAWPAPVVVAERPVNVAAEIERARREGQTRKDRSADEAVLQDMRARERRVRFKAALDRAECDTAAEFLREPRLDPVVREVMGRMVDRCRGHGEPVGAEMDNEGFFRCRDANGITWESHGECD